MSKVITFTVRQAEVWNRRNNDGSVRPVAKSTVRVAKGQPGAGRFHGATNLRGTETR